jgi:hypothetical protein
MYKTGVAVSLRGQQILLVSPCASLSSSPFLPCWAQSLLRTVIPSSRSIVRCVLFDWPCRYRSTLSHQMLTSATGDRLPRLLCLVLPAKPDVRRVCESEQREFSFTNLVRQY